MYKITLTKTQNNIIDSALEYKERLMRESIKDAIDNVLELNIDREPLIIERELSGEEILEIMDSLEAFARTLIGQVDFVVRTLKMQNSKEIIWNEDLLVIDLKKKHFPDLDINQSYGIYSKNAPEIAKIAYSMIQVMKTIDTGKSIYKVPPNLSQISDEKHIKITIKMDCL